MCWIDEYSGYILYKSISTVHLSLLTLPLSVTLPLWSVLHYEEGRYWDNYSIKQGEETNGSDVKKREKKLDLLKIDSIMYKFWNSKKKKNPPEIKMIDSMGAAQSLPWTSVMNKWYLELKS